MILTRYLPITFYVILFRQTNDSRMQSIMSPQIAEPINETAAGLIVKNF